MTLSCNICRAESSNLAAEEAAIRSNVRAFASERFSVWRCKECNSLHARDEVDLAHYYARYPFHDMPVDWRTRALYDSQLKRLERTGLRREHTILDYGCGGGHFVKHLRARGYVNAFGYDAYSEHYRDRSVLAKTYDCLVAQDIIEHVPSPHALLEEFQSLVSPGGMVALGTPNASAISLKEPERTVHALHLPFHRHILSKQALLGIGTPYGWELQRYYSTQYANTPIPFLNSAFYLYYTRLFDNSLDVLLEPPKVLPLLLRFPLTLFFGLCGYFLAPETDVMAVFRRPEGDLASVAKRSSPNPKVVERSAPTPYALRSSPSY